MRISPIKFVVFIGLMTLASQVAEAADLPTKAPLSRVAAPQFSWTGFYAGINGGWNWMRDTRVDTGPGVFGQVFPIGDTTAISQNGALAGGQIGFNYQINRWVVGLEADIDWNGAKTNQNGDVGGITFSGTYKHDVMSTFGARFGYAFDRTLLYGKGGGAWTRDVFDLSASDGSGASGRFNRWGWMIGGGVEYAIMDFVTLKAEYDYLDFGTQNQTLNFNGTDLATGTITDDPHDAKLHAHVVKVGLNFLFH